MTSPLVILDSPQAIRRHLRSGIGPHEFDAPGVRFVLCDRRNEVRAHIHVSDPPPATDVEEFRMVAGTLAEGVARTGDGNGMLLALIRSGAPTLLPEDKVWFRVACSVCAEHKVRLLGVHIVTPHGQREVLLDDAL